MGSSHATCSSHNLTPASIYPSLEGMTWRAQGERQENCPIPAVQKVWTLLPQGWGEGELQT